MHGYEMVGWVYAIVVGEGNSCGNLATRVAERARVKREDESPLSIVKVMGEVLS